MDVEKASVLFKQQLGKDLFDFFLDAPKTAQAARPGQFVHVAVPGKELRRPISLCNADVETGVIRLVFQVRGEGTQRLAETKIGDTLDLLGPLGNGFTFDPHVAEKSLLIGGGVGVPPLLFLAKALRGNACVALGFRDQSGMMLEGEFAKTGASVHIATQDGSFGYCGLVTGCAASLQAASIYACGPLPMLKAAADLARERGVPCQLSLEERMACGVGACLGCACALLTEDGSLTYGRVCKDGPVFDAARVVL